jgi:ABC-2 type transport system permease protein
MSLRHTLSVAPHLVGLFIRTQLEYRGAFFIDRVAQIVAYGAAYAGIWVILERFGTLDGWTWSDMALLLATHLLVYSMGAAASFTQMRDLEDMCAKGTFDVLLVKPYSPWAYLVFSGLNIGYAGHVVLGVGLMAWAVTAVDIAWTPGLAVYFIAAMLSGAMVVGAIITMIGASAMVLVRSRHLYSIFFGFWELVRYPLSIFPAAIQVILLTVIPLAFLNYVPAAFVLGKPIPIFGDWAGYAAPFVGPLTVALAAWHWRYCTRYYQGGGG